MDLVVAIQANILKVREAETNVRIINVVRCQLYPVMYDISEIVSAFLAQAPIDPCSLRNKGFPDG